MRSPTLFFPVLNGLAAAAAAAVQGRHTSASAASHDNGNEVHVVSCLCEDEAWDIARRWLGIFSSGGVSSKSDLATIVAADVKSYDETEGGPIVGIDQFWDAVSAPYLNATTTNVTQTPSLLLHSCDQIAYSWQYTAVTTGLNS